MAEPSDLAIKIVREVVGVVESEGLAMQIPGVSTEAAHEVLDMAAEKVQELIDRGA